MHAFNGLRFRIKKNVVQNMDEDLRGFRNLAGLGAELAETMIKAAF